MRHEVNTSLRYSVDPVLTRAGEASLGGMMKLTKATITKLEPRGTRYVAWDESLKGFGLVVQPTGAMSYIVNYRPAGVGRTGALKRLTIGSTRTLTADEARRRARELLAQVRLGSDPVRDRAAARADGTLQTLAGEFLEQHMRARRKPRSAREYEILFSKHILPSLGRHSLKEIKRADLAMLHHKISKDTPTAANRALAAFSSMWTWAARQDLVLAHENPTQAVERNPERSRQRFLSDEELTQLGATLEQAEGAGLPYQVDEDGPRAKHAAKPKNRLVPMDPRVCDIIRLLLLTGCRMREILKLRWSEADPQRGLLQLGDSKTGARAVIVSEAAMSIIMRQPRQVGSAYAFPAPNTRAGETPKPRADIKKPWDRISKHAGLEGLRVHDLRHSAASLAAGAGYSLLTIGDVLGHKQAATTARYSHLSADATRRAVEGIAKAAAAVLPTRA